MGGSACPRETSAPMPRRDITPKQRRKWAAPRPRLGRMARCHVALSDSRILSSFAHDITITSPPSVLSSLARPLVEHSMASASSAPLSTPAIPTAPVLSFSDSSIFFPPRHLSDFVIHYRDTCFHVHQLVLLCNSEYFNAYLSSHNEGLDRTQTPAHDSATSSSALSADGSNPCNHPSFTACIQLPLLQVPAIPAFRGHRSRPSSRDGVTNGRGCVSCQHPNTTITVSLNPLHITNLD